MSITHVKNCLQQCSIIKHKILKVKPFTNFSTLPPCQKYLTDMANNLEEYTEYSSMLFFAYGQQCLRKQGQKHRNFWDTYIHKCPQCFYEVGPDAGPDPICSPLCSEETAKILCQVSAEGRQTNFRVTISPLLSLHSRLQLQGLNTSSLVKTRKEITKKRGKEKEKLKGMNCSINQKKRKWRNEKMDYSGVKVKQQERVS